MTKVYLKRKKMQKMEYKTGWRLKTEKETENRKKGKMSERKTIDN